MSNPEQGVPLDLMMIRRLEEANARAYQRAAHAEEQVSEPQQDGLRQLSDRQNPTTVLASRGWLALALFASLLAASLSVVAFVWQSSYLNAGKMLIARLAPPPAQTTAQVVAPTAAPISHELAQRLQTMARDLAIVTQGIEQLKISQEHMVRDNAAFGEQLKAVLSQLTRDNAALVEQLKAGQERTVRPVATRARPKPVPTPPQEGEAVILGR
jgi:hypothetical protein